jgi:hypothetical protein
MVCRKSNPLPSTDFILYKSDITLQNFVDLQTINVPSGFKFSTSLVLNIPIASGECLWVRCSSTGSGNPDYTKLLSHTNRFNLNFIFLLSFYIIK